MNANKRKRGTSPEYIPDPKEQHTELGGLKISGTIEEDEDKVAGQQPSKLRRTDVSGAAFQRGLVNDTTKRAQRSGLLWSVNQHTI